MNYMKAIDPTLKTHIFTYTDTDSLHILGEHKNKLEKLGMIKSKEDASLGYLCSDIDNEGIIIYENNLAPKTYIYEYIDNKNNVYDKNKSTMKAKGIPKYDKSSPLYINGELQFDKKGDIIYKGLLSNNLYENYSECEPVKFSGLRKKNINLT